ncbi:MAG: hypothetical protein SNH79_05725 [Rikenellaceae bacterium]
MKLRLYTTAIVMALVLSVSASFAQRSNSGVINATPKASYYQLDATNQPREKFVFYFRQNETMVDPRFEGNDSQILILDSLLSDVAPVRNGDVINIVSTASPEGSVKHNTDLAIQRSRKIKESLLAEYPYLRPYEIRAYYFNYPWVDIAKDLEQGEAFQGRDLAVSIMRSDEDDKTKQSLLKMVSGGLLWGQLEKKVLAYNRHGIIYITRNGETYADPTKISSSRSDVLAYTQQKSYYDTAAARKETSKNFKVIQAEPSAAAIAASALAEEIRAIAKVSSGVIETSATDIFDVAAAEVAAIAAIAAAKAAEESAFAVSKTELNVSAASDEAFGVAAASVAATASAAASAAAAEVAVVSAAAFEVATAEVVAAEAKAAEAKAAVLAAAAAAAAEAKANQAREAEAAARLAAAAKQEAERRAYEERMAAEAAVQSAKAAAAAAERAVQAAREAAQAAEAQAQAAMQAEVAANNILAMEAAAAYAESRAADQAAAAAASAAASAEFAADAEATRIRAAREAAERAAAARAAAAKSAEILKNRNF